MASVRFLVAVVGDWPVVAAGLTPDEPAVVVASNRVVAATPAAREEGVVRGLRRREAQGRCPGLEVVAADPGRDARAWEPVVAAVETLTPAVEVVLPGTLALATRGPSRYFGGDQSLAGMVVDLVDGVVGYPACRVGVADGLFAARLAASVPGRLAASVPGRLAASVPGRLAASVPGRRAASVPARPFGGGVAAAERVQVIVSSETRNWLAPLPVRLLGSEFESLADLLVRLGVRTLGELAALPAPSVLGRFGAPGAAAHRLAQGLDSRPFAARRPPPELTVEAELDPPELRVEAAAFVAKSLADELLDRLGTAGLAATKVAIEVQTEHGETLVRHWRHEGSLTAGALSERTRWQLDGWLAQSGGGPTGGLTLIRLVPEEVGPDRGQQVGFWGGSAAVDERAARALARVQGMLGPESVVTAVLGGGRDFTDQVRLVPWGDAREDPVSAGAGRTARTEAPAPWPGRLSRPSPAVVHRVPLVAEVQGTDGQPVSVSGRGALSSPPVSVSIQGSPPIPVMAWNGPWPLEERWWERGGRRRARLQVVLEGEAAHLVTREAGKWWVEATYD